MRRNLTIVLVILTFLIIGTLILLLTSGSDADGAGLPSAEGTNLKEYRKSVSYSPNTSIITNIKNSTKYLRIKVTLEIKDDKSKEYYEKNDYKIKDAIIRVVRNSTEAELIAPESQNFLKDGIKAALAERIDTENLINIYIDEYVIQ